MGLALDQRFEILVVDDNPVEFRLMQEAFEAPGIRNRLHAASNGEKALAFLRHGEGFEDAPRPDLILLDINMPGQNGLDVLDAIKKDPSLKTIPIVMLTSSGEKKDIDQAYSLHANGYVRKPVDLDDFIVVMGSIENFWAGAAILPRPSAA